MALTRERLVDFMAKELKLKMAKIDDKTPLFSSGMIDSFMLVSLMRFVETEGGFRIPVTDVRLDNLDTIERILAYSQRMGG
ncbi:MAG TPA: acyl carrier protein [Minicystis sp.]|nr:acyl carrier protein [Minicystis sp.]